MSLKQVEELTPDELDECIARYILQENHEVTPSYSEDWAVGGPIVEKYLIGSEGKSAWVWYNERNYGTVGTSQLDACMKALLISRYPRTMIRITDKSEK